MKNLQLLIALSLTTLIAFSCQNNDTELVKKAFERQATTSSPEFPSLETLEIKGDIRHLDSENFNNAIMLKTGVLIDVRTPKEFAMAHIKGAQNIDVKNSNFEAEVSKLDKNTPILVYCRSGGRSSKAMGKMEDLGYKVYNLDGGLLSWMADEMWITKD